MGLSASESARLAFVCHASLALLYARDKTASEVVRDRRRCGSVGVHWIGPIREVGLQDRGERQDGRPVQLGRQRRLELVQERRRVGVPAARHDGDDIVEAGQLPELHSRVRARRGERPDA